MVWDLCYIKFKMGTMNPCCWEVKVVVTPEGWGETGTQGVPSGSFLIWVYSLCKYCAFGKISLSCAPKGAVWFSVCPLPQ